MSDKVNDKLIAKVDKQIKSLFSDRLDNSDKLSTLSLEEQRKDLMFIIEKTVEIFAQFEHLDKSDAEYLINYFEPTIEDYLFCSTIKVNLYENIFLSSTG